MKMRKPRPSLASALLFLTGAQAASGAHPLLEYWQDGALFIQKVSPPSLEKASFYIDSNIKRLSESFLEKENKEEPDIFEVYHFLCFGYFNHLLSLVPDKNSTLYTLVTQASKEAAQLGPQFQDLVKSYWEGLPSTPAAKFLQHDLNEISLKINQIIKYSSFVLPSIFEKTLLHKQPPSSLSKEDFENYFHIFSQKESMAKILDGPWKLNLYSKKKVRAYLAGLSPADAYSQMLNGFPDKEIQSEEMKAYIKNFLHTKAQRGATFPYRELNQIYFSTYNSLWNAMVKINQLLPCLEKSTPPCLLACGFRKALLKKVKQADLFSSHPSLIAELYAKTTSTYASFLKSLKVYTPYSLYLKIEGDLREFKEFFITQFRERPEARRFPRKFFPERAGQVKKSALTLASLIWTKFQECNKAPEGYAVIQMANLFCDKIDGYIKRTLPYTLTEETPSSASAPES